MREKETYIGIRVNSEEKRRIQAEAKKVGLSMSAYLLMLFRKYSLGIQYEPRNKEAQ